MDVVDADFALFRVYEYIEPAVTCNGQVVLGNLVVFRQVRIVVVLSVEFVVKADLAVSARAARIAYFTTVSFNTGKTPGMPRQTGQVCEFGASPNFVPHAQKIFVAVDRAAWTSSPIVVSYCLLISISYL